MEKSKYHTSNSHCYAVIGLASLNVHMTWISQLSLYLSIDPRCLTQDVDKFILPTGANKHNSENVLTKPCNVQILNMVTISGAAWENTLGTLGKQFGHQSGISEVLVSNTA
uniref:Uncharacterized protein n=1 Tax=Eptatretus burgeri TaxID=7764 RepID=A0A8C4WZE2_EPTBU